MSTFVYGVFSETTDFSNALSSLKSEGMDDVVIVKNTVNAVYKSATLHDNLKKHFITAGSVGAIIGGLAGVVASPTVPYTDSFQLITPIMAMVSGAVVCGYFALWTCGFLHWIDRPIMEHEVFEGEISNGSMLLGVTVQSEDEKRKAVDCFIKTGAVELIVRSESIGALAAGDEIQVIDKVRTENVALAA